MRWMNKRHECQLVEQALLLLHTGSPTSFEKKEEVV